MTETVDLDQLYQFITTAQAATYAGGGKLAPKPERPGFIEYIYEDGLWHYRDSYNGWFQNFGSELIRFKDKPLWFTTYGGGMKTFKKTLWNILKPSEVRGMSFLSLHYTLTYLTKLSENMF